MADPPDGDSSATDSDALFPFMKLPAELRQNVYDCYFEGLKDINDGEHFKHPDEGLGCLVKSSMSLLHKTFRISTLRPYFNLLHANSNIRSEAASIFYKEHVLNAELRLIICCPMKNHTLGRLRAFCTSIAAYNTNAKFTVFFAADLTDDRTFNVSIAVRKRLQFVESMEKLLKHMVQQLDFDIKVATHCTVERYADGGGRSTYSTTEAPAESPSVMPQISEFEFGRTSDLSPYSGFDLSSVFVRGPLAKID